MVIACRYFVIAAFACGNAQRPAMTDADRRSWDEAEAIASAHVRARAPTITTPIVARHPTVPYLFSVSMEPPWLLVWNGAVAEAGGLPALRAYLDSSRLLEQSPLPDVGDLVVLVQALGAWPPTQQYDRVDPDTYWLATRDHPILHPRLDRDGARTRVHLFYSLGSGRGATPDAEDSVHVAEWILILEPGTDPLWTREARIWSQSRDAWVK
jgi:hypothetical protein